MKIFCSKSIENPCNLLGLRKACIMFVSYTCVPLCTFVQVIFNLCLVCVNKIQKMNTCTGLVHVLCGTKLISGNFATSLGKFPLKLNSRCCGDNWWFEGFELADCLVVFGFTEFADAFDEDDDEL